MRHSSTQTRLKTPTTIHTTDTTTDCQLSVLLEGHNIIRESCNWTRQIRSHHYVLRGVVRVVENVSNRSPANGDRNLLRQLMLRTKGCIQRSWQQG